MYLRLGSDGFTSWIFVSQGVMCSSREASAFQPDLIGNLRIDRSVAQGRASVKGHQVRVSWIRLAEPSRNTSPSRRALTRRRRRRAAGLS